MPSPTTQSGSAKRTVLPKAMADPISLATSQVWTPIHLSAAMMAVMRTVATAPPNKAREMLDLAGIMWRVWQRRMPVSMGWVASARLKLRAWGRGHGACGQIFVKCKRAPYALYEEHTHRHRNRQVQTDGMRHCDALDQIQAERRNRACTRHAADSEAQGGEDGPIDPCGRPDSIKDRQAGAGQEGHNRRGSRAEKRGIHALFRGFASALLVVNLRPESVLAALRSIWRINRRRVFGHYRRLRSSDAAKCIRAHGHRHRRWKRNRRNAESTPAERRSHGILKAAARAEQVSRRGRRRCREQVRHSLRRLLLNKETISDRGDHDRYGDEDHDRGHERHRAGAGLQGISHRNSLSTGHTHPFIGRRGAML